MAQTIVTDKIKNLVYKFDSSKDYLASMLTGSHAQAKHSWYSDLDLVFVSREAPENHNRYWLLYDQDLLVSLNVCAKAELEGIFTESCQIVERLHGLKNAHILRDTKDNFLHSLQTQAKDFQWTNELKESAHKEAIYLLRGNAEEVHKALGGLEEKNKHAMLQGAWGICLAMPKVLALKYGIFSQGDSKLAEQVVSQVGRISLWSHYYSLATGEVASCKQNLSPLVTQTVYAVLLYKETASLLSDLIIKSFLDKEFFDVVLAKIEEVPIVKATALNE